MRGQYSKLKRIRENNRVFIKEYDLWISYMANLFINEAPVRINTFAVTLEVWLLDIKTYYNYKSIVYNIIKFSLLYNIKCYA